MAAKDDVAAVTVCSSPDSWNGLRGRYWSCRGRGQEEGLHHYSEPGGSHCPDTGQGNRRGCSNVVGVDGGVAVARNDDYVVAVGVGGSDPCNGRGWDQRWCCLEVCRLDAPGVLWSGRGSYNEELGQDSGLQWRGRSKSAGGRGSDG